MNNLVSEQEVTERGVYNEVVSLLAHMDDQDKDRIALRIASIARTKLASVVRVLLEKLQQDKQNRVAIYYILEGVLQQDTGGLEIRLVKNIVSLASDQMRETQEVSLLLGDSLFQESSLNILKLSVSHYLLREGQGKISRD
ncbi:uncharacterized protein LOC120391412 isoform X2 [Mauremys reevesii]|uniref:uncharacterized protein LOC120391412 isoform X2 n=1 Tax=Mauremys reevesii TaxID=260615 RepID=UPI00193F297A|nr:uncharacterized protein LOC120391412 isoform X2 [Mauremys reevesii]